MNALAALDTSGLVPPGHWHMAIVWTVATLGSAGSLFFNGVIAPRKERVK